MRLILSLLRYASYLLLVLIVVVLVLVYLNDRPVTEIKLDAEYAKQEELDQLVQKAKDTGLNNEEAEKLDYLLDEQRQHIEHELKRKLEKK